MASSSPPSGRDWLVLVALLPTEDPAARMRILRTLEALGAAVLREGVYLLPDRPASRQAFERLADYIRKVGSAYVLAVTASGDEQQAQFRRLFDRSARYCELVKTLEGLRIGFGIADPGAILRVIHKQRREFEAISALDFFRNSAREEAARALEAAERETRALLFPARAVLASEGEGERYRARLWVTRRPLWADRLACAWVVRRFVDPEARFVWIDKTEAAPAGAIGYAFAGAPFRSGASGVSYEEIVRRFGLDGDAALVRIGTIVRCLEAGGDPVAEAAGVQTLLQGATRRAADEDELVREAEKTFDLLYEAYSAPARD